MAEYDSSLICDRGEVESGFLGCRWSSSCRIREGRGRNRKAADRDSAPHIYCPTVGRGVAQEHNGMSRFENAKQQPQTLMNTSVEAVSLLCEFSS